jgi:hypothetical protein
MAIGHLGVILKPVSCGNPRLKHKGDLRMTMACDLSRHKPIKIRKLEEIKRENRMAPLREGPAVIT